MEKNITVIPNIIGRSYLQKNVRKSRVKQVSNIIERWYPWKFLIARKFWINISKFGVSPYPVDDVAGDGVDKYLGKHIIRSCESKLDFNI